MSYQFIRLAQEHNTALLQLFSESESGSTVFSVSRGNDFFKLDAERGDAAYYGILKEQQLIAVAGITAQYRFIHGQKEKTYYIHDLRMHPVHGSAMAYYRLINEIQKLYANDPGRNYAFSIVLGSNPFTASLEKDRTLLPAAKQATTIVHTGFPLFTGDHCYPKNVTRLDADEAWKFYKSVATQHQFASAEEHIFKIPNGIFLGVWQNKKLVAIAKMLDQSESRQIIAMQPLTLMQKIVNTYCKMRGYKGFPKPGEAFPHCYLAYYTSISGNLRNVFITAIRKHYAKRYAYIFTGLSPEEAKVYSHPFIIKFNSHVYLHGTANVDFQPAELTLI